MSIPTFAVEATCVLFVAFGAATSNPAEASATMAIRAVRALRMWNFPFSAETLPSAKRIAKGCTFTMSRAGDLVLFVSSSQSAPSPANCREVAGYMRPSMERLSRPPRSSRDAGPLRCAASLV